jgi:hypothetical protein
MFIRPVETPPQSFFVTGSVVLTEPCTAGPAGLAALHAFSLHITSKRRKPCFSLLDSPNIM